MVVSNKVVEIHFIVLRDNTVNKFSPKLAAAINEF